MYLSFGVEGRMYSPYGEYSHISNVDEESIRKLRLDTIVTLESFNTTDEKFLKLVLTGVSLLFRIDSSATKQMLNDLGYETSVENHYSDDARGLQETNFMRSIKGREVEIYFS